MSNETITILSTTAPLVEVHGDGPIFDAPGGLIIADSAATTLPVDLNKTPVLRFRVDAAPSVRTAVLITDSPYGASVRVRRCVASAPSPKWWRRLAANRWPEVRDVLNRRAPSLLALWNLFTDDVEPCTWRDLCPCQSDPFQPRGGDLIIISLVRP